MTRSARRWAMHSASRRAVATGRRPSCPARHLGPLRPALAAGSGIGLAAIELVRQVVAHEGGEAWLARAGGRPVLLSRMYSEPGAADRRAAAGRSSVGRRAPR